MLAIGACLLVKLGVNLHKVFVNECGENITSYTTTVKVTVSSLCFSSCHRYYIQGLSQAYRICRRFWLPSSSSVLRLPSDSKDRSSVSGIPHYQYTKYAYYVHHKNSKHAYTCITYWYRVYMYMYPAWLVIKCDILVMIKSRTCVLCKCMDNNCRHCHKHTQHAVCPFNITTLTSLW